MVFAYIRLMRFAVALVVSMAIASPAFAVMRPRYPVKPSPPFQGRIIFIEDDSARSSLQNSPAVARK